MEMPKIYFHSLEFDENNKEYRKINKLTFGDLNDNLAFIKDKNIKKEIFDATGIAVKGAVMTVVK